MGTISSSSSFSSKKTMNSTTYIRRAHHAGSWYSNDKDELDDTLSDFMQTARQDLSLEATKPTKLRGIICPHAGYSYSGPTAAYSYEALRHELSQRQLPKNTSTTPNTTRTTTTTILVLHPSHHFYMEDCAVSGASVLQTPLGDLKVDDELRQEILRLGNFSIMSRSVDEAEHSGEMQYPYLKKVATATGNAIKVLPIMCGNLSLQREAFYGELLSNIIARPNIVCVISTDFCHWGRRFSYQPRPDDDEDDNDKKPMEIHQLISKLDHQGMDHISMQEPCAFAQYLRQTRNTICGRHAVQVWLHAIQHNSQTTGRETLTVKFVKYDQSSAVTSMQESSVSYASAVARIKA